MACGWVALLLACILAVNFDTTESWRRRRRNQLGFTGNTSAASHQVRAVLKGDSNLNCFESKIKEYIIGMTVNVHAI